MGTKQNVTRAIAIAMSAMVTFSGLGAPLTVKADTTSTKIQTASDRAYTWLKTMQDSTYQQNLVDSFEDYDSQGVAFPISYTYDQACAAIAFLLKGDTERATRILDTLKELQVPQTDSEVKNRGAWCNSYYNNEAAYLAGQEVRLHVGVVMWVCMAVMQYEQVTGDTTTYHTMATDAIDWALQFQQANGGVAGGRTTWDSGDGSWSDEVWSSTEHNEDIYGVLLYFAENTPEEIEYIGKITYLFSKEAYYVFKYRSNSDTLDDNLRNKWLIGWSSEDGGTFSNFDEYALYEKNTINATLKNIKKKLIG